MDSFKKHCTFYSDVDNLENKILNNFEAMNALF